MSMVYNPHMGIESPTFGISEDVVTEIDDNFDNPQNIGKYIRRIMIRMRREQEDLYDSISGTAKSHDYFLYGLGAAIGFDAMTIQLRKTPHNIKITKDDIAVYQATLGEFWDDPRWNDLGWAEEQLDQGRRPLSDLTWFLEKLQPTSSHFLDYTAVFVRRLANDHKRSSFLRGIFDTMIPFFSKIEAEQMEQKFYGDGA